LAEWDSYCRSANQQTGTPAKRSVVNEPRGGAPIAEGTSRRSGGQAIRLHLVSNSFVDEFDVLKRHSARWPNGILTSGLPTSRPAQRQSPKAQTGSQPGGGVEKEDCDDMVSLKNRLVAGYRLVHCPSCAGVVSN
jgi:hypothetical protein